MPTVPGPPLELQTEAVTVENFRARAFSLLPTAGISGSCRPTPVLTRHSIKKPCEAVASQVAHILRTLGDNIINMKRSSPSVLIEAKLFVRGLALHLAGKGNRVNGVAPRPIWTPSIQAPFNEEECSKFGSETPMGRAGQPHEVAPCFVFLASPADSSYITGQVVHPNGGMVVNA
ncbi:NADPH-dependent aldehyde reductase 1, chloroplastic-like [Macadamia integrifolia]|uniref:NADPH-dependent aldehyde reductase 1, chloroplastic-like n=1 Tax=Macadamia integrifolia TaxID=60698 RepID=UPI001C529E4B|nr:NADPH-dependent aldehyde reductase 1, chloroplastic-like [Macadamia integrifolia]